MSRWDWLKVIVLVLLPINAWLGMFYYLRWQRQKAIHSIHDPKYFSSEEAIVLHHFQEKLGLKVGQPFNPLYPYTFIGSPPPFRQGYPVCFLHIAGLAVPEVWEPAIFEALEASPHLYVVLLHSAEGDLASVRQIVRRFENPRLSALVGNWVPGILGSYREGILLILCDGRGIVRALEPYPPLKVSPSLEEEVADWRPKLQQAVKKVLDKFFPKGKGR